MSTESLFATDSRLFQETAIGTGTRTGYCRSMPLVAAAAARTTKAWDSRKTPWRIQEERTPVHSSWRIRTSHTVGCAFAGWLLRSHMFEAAGGYYELRRIGNPDPSWVMQFELEDGDRIEYRGVHLEEFQLSLTEARTATLECSWWACERESGIGALEAATGSFGSDAHVASLDCRGTFVTPGPLQSNPRVNDAIDVHAAEFVMRRDMQPVQYCVDGVATQIRSAPWRVLAELTLPASSDTELAEDGESGSFGLWVGPDGADLELTSDAVKAFLAQEPLQGDGFREHFLRFDFEADTNGRLVKLIDAVAPSK